MIRYDKICTAYVDDTYSFLLRIVFTRMEEKYKNLNPLCTVGDCLKSIVE